MYEYAITAVTPRISGANRADRNIVVGPSAPPIIPMEAASSIPNPIPSDPAKSAPQKATNIPT